MISKPALFASSKLGALKVLHNDAQGFSILKDGVVKKVHGYDVDSPLKKIDSKQLSQFLKHASLKVNQFDNGDYSITTQGQIKGGGFLVPL